MFLHPYLLLVFSVVQEQYNVIIYTKHGENASTHPKYVPDLWLEARATGEPNKNRVYNISMTMTRDIRSSCSVSTISTP